MKLRKIFSLERRRSNLIENIRFFKEETEDDQGFSKKLGRLETFTLTMHFHVLIENRLLCII